MENAGETLAMPPLAKRPAHIPAELVRPYPFVARSTTSTAIPRDFIPEIHKGPPVFWVDAVPYERRLSARSASKAVRPLALHERLDFQLVRRVSATVFRLLGSADPHFTTTRTRSRLRMRA
jgi:hypothetical protein